MVPTGSHCPAGPAADLCCLCETKLPTLLVKQSHLALLVSFRLTRSAIYPSVLYWSVLLTAVSPFRSYDRVSQDSPLIVSHLMEELFSFCHCGWHKQRWMTHLHFLSWYKKWSQSIPDASAAILCWGRHLELEVTVVIRRWGHSIKFLPIPPSMSLFMAYH